MVYKYTKLRATGRDKEVKRWRRGGSDTCLPAGRMR
jgi:hypothetical protein